MASALVSSLASLGIGFVNVEHALQAEGVGGEDWAGQYSAGSGEGSGEPYPGGCDAVIAHYSSNVSRAAQYLNGVRAAVPTGCRIVVYDKSEQPCKFMPFDRVTWCNPLRNVGREQHTFAHHIAQNYESLPAQLLLLTSDLRRYRRSFIVQDMLSAARGGAKFACGTHYYGTAANKDVQPWCHLDRYGSCRQTRYPDHGQVVDVQQASVGGLTRWLAAFVDPHGSSRVTDRLCNLPVCHYGLIFTTRDNLLMHPQTTYRNVAEQLSHSSLPEEAFYMEWAAAALYGVQSGEPTCATNATSLPCNEFKCQNAQDITMVSLGLPSDAKALTLT